MRKIYLDVKLSVVILADDDIEIGSIMDNLDTQVTSDSDKFDVEVIDISEPNITDIK
jgi:hypothetical protein